MFFLSFLYHKNKKLYSKISHSHVVIGHELPGYFMNCLLRPRNWEPAVRERIGFSMLNKGKYLFFRLFMLECRDLFYTDLTLTLHTYTKKKRARVRQMWLRIGSGRSKRTLLHVKSCLRRAQLQMARYSASGQLMMYSAQDESKFPKMPTQPTKIAVDGLGRVHVMTRSREGIYRYAADGSSEGTFAADRPGRPMSIGVDTQGNFTILDAESPHIRLYDQEGGTEQQTACDSREEERPRAAEDPGRG